MDRQAFEKFENAIFFKIFKIPSNGQLTKIFFKKKNSTNTVARAVQSFGRNEPWLAGWLRNNWKFFVSLAQTWDEEMLKISGRYLDSCLSNVQITEKLLLLLPPQWALWPLWGQKWPLWWQVPQKFFVNLIYDVHRLALSNFSIISR